MKIFLVLPRKGYAQGVEAKIKEQFPGYYMEIPDRDSKAWILAADKLKTTFEVSLALNIHTRVSMENRNDGIVIGVEDYYGHDLTEIWQKMDIWRVL